MYNETGVCVGLFQQELINKKIKNKMKKKDSGNHWKIGSQTANIWLNLTT